MSIEERARARRLSISSRELLIAAMKNDLKTIDDLLKIGVDVNYKDRDGNAALHYAVEGGSVKAVEFLLSKGASLNEKNKDAETPLDVGKRLNNREMIDVLKRQTSQNDAVLEKEPDHSQSSQNCNNAPTTDESMLGRRTNLEPPKPTRNEVVLEQEPASDHSCPIQRPNDSAPGDAQENNENMPERRKNAVHGNIYQLQLLMLFLYRGVSHKYSFRLGTEIQEAKKFDDLVFEYDVRGERVYRLLQAKRRLDESKTINAGNLLSENDGDFSLVKYFFSYLALKKDKLFSGGKVKDVTICTNIDFDIQNLERNGISVERIEERDEIFDVKSARKESARYRFSESIVNLMKPKLKSYNSPRFRRTENYTDSDIGEFIKRLVFAVNRPNEDELGHIVENEICKEFDFITAENVYNKFFMSMLNWLQGKERGVFLSYEDGKKFFVEFNRTIQLWFGIKSPVESFLGRTEFLKNLHELMCSKNAKDEKSQFVCVSGLGGVGKSELARKYVSEYSQDYDNKIVWINAESYETLADSFRRLACDQLKISTLNADNKEKKLNSTVEDVYAFFSDKKCLFIFDNAEKYKSQDEFDNGIEVFLPSLPDARNRLHVLITSRNQKWPKNIKVLSLDVFSENEATNFVKKSLSLKGNEECEEVKKLVNELQLFPLALQQAVAYIGLQDEKLKNVGSDFKISNYLKKLKQKTKEYLQFTEGNDNDYSKTTYSTWNVTIEAIRQKEHGIKACEILEILSYFAPADIYVSTIKSLVKDETTLASAIDLLKQYSIVNEENAKLSMHRLVLKVMRLHLEERNKEQKVLYKALNLFSTRTLNSENIEHAISVWNNTSKYCDLLDHFSALSNDISTFLMDNWRYEEAELFGVKASKRLDALTSKTHATKLNLIATKKNTASALHRRAKLTLAIKYYEEVYSLQKRMLGPRDLDTLESKNQTAIIFTEMCQYDRALQLYEDIIAINSKSLGNVHPITLRTQLSKAKLLSHQGKYKKALALLKEILAINEMVLGEKHPECLNIKSRISDVLSHLSQLDEARAIEEELEQAKKQPRCAKNNLDQILVRADRGTTLLQQGRYTEALSLLEEAYTSHTKIFGEDHPGSLNIRRNLGEALRYLGKLDEALKIFQQVHKKQMKISDSTDIMQTKESIGHVHLERQNYTEALQFQQEALKMCEKIYGKEHPKYFLISNYIALVFLLRGDYDTALKYGKEILEGQKKIFGDDHLDILSTKHTIATALHNKGELDEAIKIYKEIANLEKDSAHPDSLAMKEKIVDILCKQKKLKEALQLCREMLTTQEKAFGKNHKDTVMLRHKMSDMLYQTGRRYECLKILREISKIADEEVWNEMNVDNFNQNLRHMEIETAIALTLVIKNNPDGLRKALREGLDVNTASESDDETLLHYAISCNHRTILEILLENKADVTLGDVHGNTALHEAAKIGMPHAVKLLLKYGSIYNKRNKRGATPLDLCKEETVKKFLTTVEELFDDARKGNPGILEKLESMKSDELKAVQEARNNDEKTLLQVIIMNRHVDLSHKMLELIRGKK
ncbi:uncharacterized protein LOC103316246 [Nasonia vitripennis]|uniref:NB-ARC domain-containing protein n=1 Tax=Nasonia vitripennis TaxID=7425 RepID=A0A7M7H451_NASVI|nr:uncharacterized protein LOC103316246 [Nasonia vitripennis]XP_016841036.1 uncharacterized protein LOC103316246 [Nasonia vitripennis]XP_016841037.1 uncharacterized protein LOC103316246 [Nasonia vitripennis]